MDWGCSHRLRGNDLNGEFYSFYQAANTAVSFSSHAEVLTHSLLLLIINSCVLGVLGLYFRVQSVEAFVGSFI